MKLGKKSYLFFAILSFIIAAIKAYKGFEKGQYFQIIYSLIFIYSAVHFIIKIKQIADYERPDKV